MTAPSKALPRAVAVVGPTAAGKSRLGLHLAESMGGRVLACDSVQVFRGLDIGSAKPDASERERVPHRLIDQVAPDESFSAGDYAAAAWRELEAEGAAVFVGGTGFYLRAVAWTHSSTTDPALDDPRRAAFESGWLEREAAQPGAVHRALNARDPETAREVHARNVLRALRALWLCELHGEPVSAVRRRHPPRERLSLLLIHVDPGVEVVDRAIDARCDRMIAAGWLAEVEMLRARGYDGRYRSMRSLGYKQLLAHLEGQCTLEAAVREIKLATRRYARRQRTYFRHQFPTAMRVDVGRDEPSTRQQLVDRIQQFLSGDSPCPPKS